MGNSQASQPTQFLEDWVQLQKNTVNTGTSNVWANKKDRRIQMEEYPLYVTSQQQVKQQKKIHQFRHNHPQVVASLYFIDETQEQFCSSNYQGKIFLQKISLTLVNIGDIPFPDALHLYSQALQGFHVLSSQVQQGCFPISQQHIGINCNSIVKVWMNTQYQKNFPNRNQRISEQKMVHMILDIIDSNVDYDGARNQYQNIPTVSRYIYQNSRAPSEVKFNEAINVFRDYVNRFFCGKIPERMNCVDQVGGSDYLYKSWNEQANRFSNSNTNNNNYNNQSQSQVQGQGTIARGFTKTQTIPSYPSNQYLNQSYTSFRREEPIVNVASSTNINGNVLNNGLISTNTITNANTNTNLNSTNTYNTYNGRPLEALERQFHLSSPPTPVINYSPSGFLNTNTNINTNAITLNSPRQLNQNNLISVSTVSQPKPQLHLQPQQQPQNHVLIRSNVRPVEEPRKSQIITNVSSNAPTKNFVQNIRAEQIRPAQSFSYQPQILPTYQQEQRQRTFIQPTIPTTLNYKPQSVVTFQSNNINQNQNIPALNQNQPMTIRRQFNQSIIQNRVVHHGDDSFRNVQQQQQITVNRPNVSSVQPQIDFSRTAVNISSNSQIDNGIIPVSQQQRSIYVPMPSKNVSNIQPQQSSYTFDSKATLIPSQYTKVPQQKVNQNTNTQRVTSQIIVMDKYSPSQSKNTWKNEQSANSISSNSKNNNIFSIQQKSVKSPDYSEYNKSDLSGSKYDNLKLDDGMSSAAFLNELKNIKNISTEKITTTENDNIYKKKYEYTEFETVPKRNYQNNANQYENQDENNSYQNKYGGSYYHNLNIQMENSSEVVNPNSQNGEIRYEYLYKQGEYGNDNGNDHNEHQYSNDHPDANVYQEGTSGSREEYDEHYNEDSNTNSNNNNNNQYRSYFDKYASYNFNNENKQKSPVQQVDVNSRSAHHRHTQQQQEEEYKVQYDPQILADLRKLQGEATK